MRFSVPLTDFSAVVNGPVTIAGGTLDNLTQVTNLVKTGPQPSQIASGYEVLTGGLAVPVSVVPTGKSIRLFGAFISGTAGTGTPAVFFFTTSYLSSLPGGLPADYIIIYATYLTSSLSIPLPLIIPPSGVLLPVNKGIGIYASANINVAVNIVYDYE